MGRRMSEMRLNRAKSRLAASAEERRPSASLEGDEDEVRPQGVWSGEWGVGSSSVVSVVSVVGVVSVD